MKWTKEVLQNTWEFNKIDDSENAKDWRALLLAKLSFKPVCLLALNPDIFNQYMCYEEFGVYQYGLFT